MMRFVSTRGRADAVGLREALDGGSAPDGGLWVPEPFPAFGALRTRRTRDLRHFREVAEEAALPWLEPELGGDAARALLRDTMHVPIRLRPLDPAVRRLDLTRGPSASFKDVGARFLTGLWGAMPRPDGRVRTILVATSGDTGGAVAAATHRRPGVRAVILYPPGRISDVQRRQFTTAGDNVRAVAVEGSFDDAQAVAREAFSDLEVVERFALVSANSINPGRLLPQTLYYRYLTHLLELEGVEEPGAHPIVVPSGNLGNVTAAVWARRMGSGSGPIHAAVNENDALVRALRDGSSPGRAAVATDSTAMDVGRPSNLERLAGLAQAEGVGMDALLDAGSIPVEEAREAQRRAARDHSLLIDPHTAVGYALALRLREAGPHLRPIVIETAHPAKFPEVMEVVTGHTPDPPPPLARDANTPESIDRIDASLAALERYLESLP